MCDQKNFKMKYIAKFTLGLLVGIGLLASCSDDSDEKSVGFSLDKEEITIANNGGTEQLNITSSVKWSVSTDASWVTVTPSNGLGSEECTIVVDSTVNAEMRQTTIRVMAEGQASKKITVYQMGYEKGIYLQSSDTTIESSGKLDERVLKMKVTTNVKFKNVDVLDATTNEKISWLEYKEKEFDLDYGDRPRTIQLNFNWSNNPEEKKRAAKIVLTPVDEAAKVAVLTVNQKAAPAITDDRAGDSLALLAVVQMMNFTMGSWDPSENMQYWDGVALWEKTDKEVKENPKMLGRVRSVNFNFFDTKESIPYQVAKLTYVETLGFFSNVNLALKDITLDADPLLNLKYLKNLNVTSYGINAVANNFVELGDRLVSLDFSGNHFSKLPDLLTPGNFPKLTTLRLGTQRRWDTIKDLQNDDRKDNIGLHIKTTSEDFQRLLTWNALDTLVLSYAFIEGELPDYVDGVGYYTSKEIAEKKLSKKLEWQSKVLPDTRYFTLNLNFLTGKLPDWLLFHPHLSDWDPLILFFVQEEGKDSDGKKAGFTNSPSDLEYYYKEYPDKRPEFDN